MIFTYLFLSKEFSQGLKPSMFILALGWGWSLRFGVLMLDIDLPFPFGHLGMGYTFWKWGCGELKRRHVALNPSIYPYSTCMREILSRSKSPPSLDITLSNQMEDKLHEVYVRHGKATHGFIF